jgi:hypothetical protein
VNGPTSVPAGRVDRARRTVQAPFTKPHLVASTGLDSASREANLGAIANRRTRSTHRHVHLMVDYGSAAVTDESPAR